MAAAIPTNINVETTSNPIIWRCLWDWNPPAEVLDSVPERVSPLIRFTEHPITETVQQHLDNNNHVP